MAFLVAILDVSGREFLFLFGKKYIITMERKSKTPIWLFILLFVTIVALSYCIKDMINPGEQTMNYYFGFGADAGPIGFLAFSFTLISGFAMIFFGYLADKMVRVRILLIGSFLYSISAILTIIVPSDITGYYIFFTLQIIYGIGFGAIIPNMFSLIGDFISRDNRSKGFSFFSIASLIGTALGYGLGTAFLDSDWRMGYLIVGSAGMVTTIFIIFLKEPNRIGKDNLFLANKEAVDYTYRIKKEDLKVVLGKRANQFLIINFVDTIPTGIILFLLYRYLNDVHGIPEDQGLFFLALVLVSTLVGTIIFGYVGDNLFKTGHKKARVLLALMANVVPIPFVFIGLIIPFRLPESGSFVDLFFIPNAVIMLVLFMIGLFINGATNGSWYATVVDINLPEHRGTVLATANFFDIVGRALGPLIGSIVADNFGVMMGMVISIFFWIALPFFWIPVLKNVVSEMDQTQAIFQERLEELKKQK